jgi:hypothetical protein
MVAASRPLGRQRVQFWSPALPPVSRAKPWFRGYRAGQHHNDMIDLVSSIPQLERDLGRHGIAGLGKRPDNAVFTHSSGAVGVVPAGLAKPERSRAAREVSGQKTGEREDNHDLHP